MSDYVLKVENVSKKYRLGVTGTSTVSDDLKRLWAKLKTQDDPLEKLDQLVTINIQKLFPGIIKNGRLRN